MIELKNIVKRYCMGDQEVMAVAGVSLKIAAGEFVAIMGSSGSGKSTLMHIMGLLDRPEAGTYILAGQDITGLSDDQLAALRNRLIGFVFQQFHLLARRTALENAGLPLIYAGRRQMQDKVKAELTAVGLADRAGHRPNELSGGQQQRVAIARALVNDPLIIMADEPTGNLDTKSKDEIVGILKQLHAQGKTIVMVTHEPEMAAHAGRVIQMRDGRILSDEVRSKPNTVSAAADLEAVVKQALAASQKTYDLAKFFDSFRQAIYAMVSNKMRSFLSILGILIGVAAVIAMLALGRGAQESIESQLASLGSNLLMVRPGQMRVQGVALQAGSVTRLTFQDLTAVGQLPYARRVSPSVTGHVQVVYAGKNANTQVEGVSVDYAAMRASEPIVGRFFNDDEYRSRAKVAVLGTTVVKELFGDTDPIGETIKINLINFTVIGILPPKGANSFRDQDDAMIVPATTAMYRLLGKEYLDSIYVEGASPDTLDALQGSATDLLLKRHHLSNKPDSQDAFQVRNMADIKAALETTTKTMTMLLGSIAAISLLVGGIGIMNIMLVSVTERTREIGLRKAIGATRRDILMQFLVESVLMACIGGITGIILGVGVSLLLTLLAGWSISIAPSSVVLATAFSVSVGVVFGLWPAQKASRLDPIEALRYE
jgi:macrolide transport system ATP-binding/permease protein